MCSATCPYLVLEVRREHLMQDTLAQLRSRKTQDLKKPLKIKYVESGEEGAWAYFQSSSFVVSVVHQGRSLLISGCSKAHPSERLPIPEL